MLALIYDIHGNRIALDAVLADAGRAGAAHYLLGGDYCMLGAEPTATLARLRELPADTIWLRGNTERWIADPAAGDVPSPLIAEACVFAGDAIGRAEVHELAALPQMLAEVPRPGAAGVIFCHASPGSDMVGFTDQPAESDGTAADSGLEANTIVCGHTHIQFVREVGVIQIVNPGSCGLPLDGDRRAAYCLLHEDGSFEPRRVEYDVEAAIATYDGNDAPWAQTARRRLREASAVA